MEKIPVKPLYTEDDIAGMEHLSIRRARRRRVPPQPMPRCIASNRGPSASTPASPPPRNPTPSYRRKILSRRPERPLRRLRPRHPRLWTRTTRASSATSARPASFDMKVLFGGIPLDKVSVSMTMARCSSPSTSSPPSNRGATLDQLAGTIQNDILKEYMVRNTYIYPPGAMDGNSSPTSSTSQRCPNSTQIQSAGLRVQKPAPPPNLMRLRPRRRLGCLPHRPRRGIDVDAFAAALVLLGERQKPLYGSGENARRRAVGQTHQTLYNPQNPNSLALRTHSQTSGWSLTEQDPFNNISRTCIEAMAAALGHTQSLHTNSLDGHRPAHRLLRPHRPQHPALPARRNLNLCGV